MKKCRKMLGFVLIVIWYKISSFSVNEQFLFKRRFKCDPRWAQYNQNESTSIIREKKGLRWKEIQRVFSLYRSFFFCSMVNSGEIYYLKCSHFLLKRHLTIYSKLSHSDNADNGKLTYIQCVFPAFLFFSSYTSSCCK